MTVQTTEQLRAEFAARAAMAELQIDCPMDGSVHADIVVIGESPGPTEKQNGRPLSGGSGSYLWDALRKYGITRQRCYITNVVKRSLVFSHDQDKSPIQKWELDHWCGLLEWELAQLPNVKYIIALGNYALNALTGENKITNWRGSVSDIRVGDRTVPALFTYNPAMIFRERKLDIVFKFDIHKFKRMMDGTWKKHEITAHINPSFVEACRWIDRMHDDKLPISIDIETTGGETACIGLANSAHEGLCINWRGVNDNRYSIREERILHRRLQRLFDDNSTRLVAQNGNFDAYWLWYKDRLRLRNMWFDTLLAHHTLYPGLPHGLGFLTAQYTDHPYYKDEKDAWREGGDIDTFWEYNVKDCCITRAVQERELEELRQQNLDQFFFQHVMRLQPELVLMTVGGVRADIELKDRLAERLRNDVALKLQEFHRAVQLATGDETCCPNPGSPKQLGDVLFRRLRLVGRGGSTNAENRDRMRKHPRTNERARRVLDLVDEYATDNKFLGTYVEMKVDDDKRIRCEYKQFGTTKAPGRLSSSQTMWGSGMNLQNQPERAQEMFIADNGYEFSYFDLSQAEARVVSLKAKVPALKENFRLATENPDKYDVHRLNAARIFGVSYDDVPKDDRIDGEPTKRFLGKRCVHGLNYRMGPDRLATVCKIPLSQAIEAYHAYHAAFPEIRQWWEDTIKQVKQTRSLYNAMGRRLILLDPRLDDSALESIIAFYPQSTIGDFVSSIIYKCHSDPDWPKYRNGQLAARMALNVHDALIALNRVVDGEQVRYVMKKHAEKPILIDGEPLSIPCDLKVSVPDEFGVRRWSTLKKVA